jgi:hypothetical protein
MVTQGGVRWRHLVSVAVVVCVLAYAALRLTGGATTPSGGWLLVAVLVVMATVVYVAGLPVRRMRLGRPGMPVSPLRAARTLVLAQAAALSGAGLVGWYAAQALRLAPDLDVASQRTRMWPVLAQVAASVALVASGLLVQRMCRIDDDSGDAAQTRSSDPVS